MTDAGIKKHNPNGPIKAIEGMRKLNGSMAERIGNACSSEVQAFLLKRAGRNLPVVPDRLTTREKGLVNSIDFKADSAGTKVEIFSTCIYAAVHEFGAKIKVFHAKALFIPLVNWAMPNMPGLKYGVDFVWKKAVTIPKRQFMWNNIQKILVGPSARHDKLQKNVQVQLDKLVMKVN